MVPRPLAARRKHRGPIQTILRPTGRTAIVSAIHREAPRNRSRCPLAAARRCRGQKGHRRLLAIDRSPMVHRHTFHGPVAPTLHCSDTQAKAVPRARLRNVVVRAATRCRSRKSVDASRAGSQRVRRRRAGCGYGTWIKEQLADAIGDACELILAPRHSSPNAFDRFERGVDRPPCRGRAQSWRICDGSMASGADSGVGTRFLAEDATDRGSGPMYAIVK